MTTEWRAYLQVRQVRSVALAVIAVGLLVAIAGDRALLLPGSGAPVRLWLVGPVVGVGACVLTLDPASSDVDDLERVSPRRTRVPRTTLLFVLAVFATAVLLGAGTVGLGSDSALTLARDVPILLGPAALVWSVAGRTWAVATAGALSVGVAYLGRHGAAPGELVARWAVLAAEPTDGLATIAAVVGPLVALAVVWSRDDLRDRRVVGGRRRRLPSSGSAPEHKHDTAS